MGINTEVVEEKYGVKYIGFYDIPAKTKDGKDTEREHIYVFYQANPKVDLGHSNYLGVFEHYVDIDVPPTIYLTNAKSILEAKYPAHRFEDGTYICTRYRHDYVTGGEGDNFVMLDGGISYARSGGKGANGYVRIVDDHEEFVPYS